MSSRRVLVCGGRNYDNYETVAATLNVLLSPTHIIHGGATGADALAGSWARSNGVQEVVCPANWGRYGKAAGYKRNVAMLDLCPDLVIAFPGGKGTANMVELARRARVPVTVVG